MLTFWLCLAGIFGLTTISTLCNNKLNNTLTILIPWIEKTLLPILQRNSRFNECRELSKNVVPTLTEWLSNTMLYRSTILGLQLTLLTIAILVIFSHSISYILLIMMAMLLGTMTFFFPRTVLRIYKVGQYINHFYYVYKKMVTCEKINNDSNKTRTNIHG